MELLLTTYYSLLTAYYLLPTTHQAAVVDDGVAVEGAEGVAVDLGRAAAEERHAWQRLHVGLGRGGGAWKLEEARRQLLRLVALQPGEARVRLHAHTQLRQLGHDLGQRAGVAQGVGGVGRGGRLHGDDA
eukprot:scaffold91486_cov109-Phaeocystis_antarctica.AAC.1